MNKDSLGNRMKNNYEDITRFKLPKRTYSIIRLDGKSFHTYTKNLKRPFDLDFINDIDETAKYLCDNVQGVKLAFVQSDEISLVLTDFDKLNTSSYFDGNIQKIASVTASISTAKFNQLRMIRNINTKTQDTNWEKVTGKTFKLNIDQCIDTMLATFDSRVFTIPTKTEVINYLIWRQQDTVRNSIQNVAQSLYSQKELHCKNTKQLQELIFQKGINWDNYDAKLKRGRLIIKDNTKYIDKYTKQKTNWYSIAPEIFTQNKDLLNELLPQND